MPDPALYMRAMAAACVATFGCALALYLYFRQPLGAASQLVAFVAGAALGYHVLQFRLTWPPTSALARLLTIVLPVVIGCELLLAWRPLPRWTTWCLRAALAAAASRILLHGSVYLSDFDGSWTRRQVILVVTASAMLQVVTAGLLVALAQRSAHVSLSLALAMTVACAGVTVMLCGYIRGAEAAWPLAAALVGVAVASMLLGRGTNSQAVFVVAVAGLFGLLFIGRFFGGLSTWQALIILMSPLMAWLTELRVLRNRPPWQIGTLRLVLVAIPLIATAAAATFDTESLWRAG